MLTQRAKTYLSRLRRIDEWNIAPEQVAAYSARQKVTLSNELLKIQQEYAGYELEIQNHPGKTFLLNFISKQELITNASMEFYSVDDGYLLEFGEHATAQFNFYITDKGQVCTWGAGVGDTPNVICSSVEKLVEQYAMQNELASQIEYPGYYRVLNQEKLHDVLQSEFVEIPECGDSYSFWCSNDLLTVVKGTWLHEPTFYLHVYGRMQNACEVFIERLKAASIIN